MNTTGNNGLTPKQRRFCEKYVVCLEAKRAAIEAGYTERSATVTSTRLMKRPEVRQYITMLQAEAAERNNVTVDEVIEKLRDTYKAAKEANQNGPAVRAVELLGKTVGMFKDQVVLTELQATSDDDLVEKMAKGDAKIAAALRELLGAPDTFDVPEVRH